MAIAITTSASTIHHLRDLLQARLQKNDGMTFDELRSACMSASNRLQGRTAGISTSTPMPTEAGSVLAAHVVYCYLKRSHKWHWTRDRRDRLYNVPAMLDTLVTMPA